MYLILICIGFGKHSNLVIDLDALDLDCIASKR